MKVLLLGANGQLGLDFIDECFGNSEIELFAFSRAELDISHADLLSQKIEKLKPHYIVNCAAFTNVDGAEDEQNAALAINCSAVKNLAYFAKKHDAVLIHISTDYVFNGEKNTPYSENDLCNPLGFYGLSKRMGEEAIIELNLPSVILRTSWLYSHRGKNFMKSMIRLGKERNELNVVFDQVGTPTYAAHLARVILKIIHLNYKPVAPEIFHFGNEGVCSWYDFAQEIMDQAEIHCRVNPIESKDFPTKTKRPSYSVLNKAKIKRIFDLEIPHWKKALTECLAKN